jgi:methanogenic corrinoid protein MtbC1
MGRPLKNKQGRPRDNGGDQLAPEMEALAHLVADLREEEVLLRIEAHLSAGVAPEEIFSACQKGMRLVGSMHEKGQYFIAGLIMAGEIMREAVNLLSPIMTQQRSTRNLGRVLLGTIAGDIHDIGKNLFKDLLECHGFTVMDLGVDVPPVDFLHAHTEFKPHLVAASALITECFPRLRELTVLFETAAQEWHERPLILIGGGQVDETVFRMSGSDYWAPDAFAGVRLCQKLMAAGQKTHGERLT